MLNQLILMGRLTANPIVRENKADETKSFTTFTLAFDNISKDESSFIDCVAFNNTGTALSKYASKGDKIAVVGAIRQRSYVKSDGSKAKVFEVVVDSVEFLQPKKEEKANPEEIPPFNDGDPVEEEKPPLADGWHYDKNGKAVKDEPKKTAPKNK